MHGLGLVASCIQLCLAHRIASSHRNHQMRVASADAFTAAACRSSVVGFAAHSFASVEARSMECQAPVSPTAGVCYAAAMAPLPPPSSPTPLLVAVAVEMAANLLLPPALRVERVRGVVVLRSLSPALVDSLWSLLEPLQLPAKQANLRRDQRLR